MEKSPYRLRVALCGDSIMVYPGQYLIRMEILRTELSSMDSWQTCDFYPVLSFSESDASDDLMTLAFGSRRWEKCFMVCKPFYIFFLENSTCWPVLRLSRTSTPCGNLGLHHWHFIIVTSGRMWRRTGMGCYHLCLSSFVINLTPTAIFFSPFTRNMQEVRNSLATMHLPHV